MRVWTGLECPVAGFCENSSVLLGTIKGEEVIGQLSEYPLLKDSSVPRSNVAGFDGIREPEVIFSCRCFVFLE